MWKIETLHKWQVEDLTGRKIRSIKNETKTNLHHTLPKSREKAGLEVHDRSWHIELAQDLHSKFHELFYNLLPHEQLMMWVAINWNGLSEQVKSKLLEIEIEDFYPHNLKR